MARIPKFTESRNIRVFISSTFKDMKGERDRLLKKVFPKLRKIASEYNVTVTEVDLRWGITGDVPMDAILLTESEIAEVTSKLSEN